MKGTRDAAKLTARWPDLPPTSPGPKPLSGSAQALVWRGAGMFSGGSDADAGPVVMKIHFCSEPYMISLAAQTYMYAGCHRTLILFTVSITVYMTL